MKERIKHSVEQDAYLRIKNSCDTKKRIQMSIGQKIANVQIFGKTSQLRKQTGLTLSKYCKIVILGVLRAWNFAICLG